MCLQLPFQKPQFLPVQTENRVSDFPQTLEGVLAKALLSVNKNTVYVLTTIKLYRRSYIYNENPCTWGRHIRDIADTYPATLH